MENPPSQNHFVRYYKYNFFKIIREWRFLKDSDKLEQKKEFSNVIKENMKQIEMSFFSLSGLRHDVDFMILAEVIYRQVPGFAYFIVFDTAR